MLCKGAHLDRAAFSALTLLEGARTAIRWRGSDVFDTVPQRAAERLTRYWRSRPVRRSPLTPTRRNERSAI